MFEQISNIKNKEATSIVYRLCFNHYIIYYCHDTHLVCSILQENIKEILSKCFVVMKHVIVSRYYRF